MNIYDYAFSRDTDGCFVLGDTITAGGENDRYTFSGFAAFRQNGRYGICESPSGDVMWAAEHEKLTVENVFSADSDGGDGWESNWDGFLFCRVAENFGEIYLNIDAQILPYAHMEYDDTAGFLEVTDKSGIIFGWYLDPAVEEDDDGHFGLFAPGERYVIIPFEYAELRYDSDTEPFIGIKSAGFPDGVQEINTLNKSGGIIDTDYTEA
jgi:hypothetical protein